jgi:hypothetical protein
MNYDHLACPSPDEAGEYTRALLADGLSCFEAAKDYLARGWCVLPACHPSHVGLREHSRTCTSPGKCPLVRWTEFQEHRPTARQLESWWKRWPLANVGILLGKVSGLIGLDIDGPLAEAKVREWNGGSLPETLMFHTPRPGLRFLFAYPEDVEVASTTITLAEGQELKFMADGAFTVMPPSRHWTKALYGW